MLDPCSGFIPDDGNNIKSHLHIKVLFIDKIINCLDQLS